MERSKTKLPCCEAGGRYIYLGYDFTFGPNLDGTVENYLAHVQSVPPRWLVRVGEPKTTEEYRAPYVPPIAVVCPFCTTAVPAVVLRKDPPDKLRIIVDGGYRCMTCEERLDNCDCARPAELWAPVP
jgi:hypothetical protein